MDPIETDDGDPAIATMWVRPAHATLAMYDEKGPPWQ